MKTAMRMGCTKHSRPRTLSCSVLPPKDELLRESIRHQVASEPYVNMTKEKTWEEANRLASSLEKKAVVVRKAIYNRRQFVNKKISDALVKFEVVDPRSPAIYEIAEIAQTIAINVVHFLETHHQKILEQIRAKAAPQIA
uniref:Aldedh domain-containing protein n=1 Tax=Caenorhabditis tropicalis TaxID=1561998 RepID=A0A1I7THM5_9PELO